MWRAIAIACLCCVALSAQTLTTSPVPWAEFYMPKVLASSPTEPHACDADHIGSTVYVNDTDDALAGAVCSCQNTAIGGFDWVAIGQVSIVTGLALPCPFF